MWCDDIFEKDWEIAVRMYIKIKFIFVTNLKQACADASKNCTYKYFVQQNVSDGSKTLLYHFFITQIFIVFWVNYTCLAILVSNQRWQ